MFSGREKQRLGGGGGGGGETTACVRVPVNNKFAVTRYMYQGCIGLQSTYVDTHSYIYVTSTLHVPSKTESEKVRI